MDRIGKQPFYTAYSGVSHVILGSGLTIVGATLCLSLTRLPLFRSMGVPCALVILVIVAAALTLAPAILALGSRFGLFEPKRKYDEGGWRRIGAAVVRWRAHSGGHVWHCPGRSAHPARLYTGI